MSATILKERLIVEIDKEIVKYSNMVLNVRRQGALPTMKGVAIVPAVTPEDIAMMVLEANSYRRALEDAKATILHEHQLLIAPDSIKSGAVEGEESGELY